MNGLRHLKIWQKLTLGFLVVIALTTLIQIKGLLNIKALASLTSGIYLDKVQPMMEWLKLKDTLQHARLTVFQLLAETRPAEQKKLTEQVQQELKQIEEWLQHQTLASSTSPEHWENLLSLWKTLQPSYLSLLESVQNFDLEGAVKLAVGDNQKQHDELMAVLQKIVTNQEQGVHSRYQESQTVEQQTYQTTVTIFLLVLLLTGGIVWGLVRAITHPVAQMIEQMEALSQGRLQLETPLISRDEIGLLSASMRRMVSSLQEKVTLAERIAQGDLRVEVIMASEQDALGHALAEMTTQLNQALREMRQASERLSLEAHGVAEASDNLARGATQQASALEEIGASVVEITQQTEQNAQNSQQANHLASEASQAAKAGDAQMKIMIEAMSQIEVASQDISKIIRTIDEIAFQTNLLALNAAVEAARAGKYGKGFAVVAEEVRNLAERSAQAAKETTTMIEDSGIKVRQGREIANRTASSLNQIVQTVTKVSDLIGEINSASQEQSNSLRQINVGVDQVAQVTQNNTSTSEQTATSAQEMAKQAERLHEMLANFQVKEASDSHPESLSPELLAAVQQYMQAHPAPIQREERFSQVVPQISL